MLVTSVLITCLSVILACSDKGEDDTGSGPGDDGGTTDGGTSDGGTSDGGTTDGGTSDGGTTDGGTTDGGTTDGGTSDGGTSDDADGDGSLTGVDCDDADPDVYPGAPAVCGDGVVNDCDGTEADEAESCLLTATFTGHDEYGSVGLELAGGDLDGDGLADLVLADPSVEGTASRDGMVYAFLGLADGDRDTSDADLSIAGEAGASGAAGTRIGLSDIDGDGNLDLLVGAMGIDHDVANAGSAYLFYGPILDVDSVDDADRVLVGSTGTTSVGMGQYPAGDWSGDGHAELLVGHARSAGPRALTVVEVATGSERSVADGEAGILDEDDITVGGDSSIAGADLDGDGVGDVVISAMETTVSHGEESSHGRAYVHLGPIDDERGVSDADARVTMSEEYFAPRLASGGDADGDGQADLVVAQPTYESAAVMVFAGPLSGEHTRFTADAVYSAPSWPDLVGGAVGFAGDVDGDGAEDLVVGAGTCSAGISGVSCGKGGGEHAWLLLAPIAGGSREISDADYFLAGGGNGTGNAVAGLGDATGDGVPDVAVGRFDYDVSPWVNQAMVFSPGGI